MRTIVRSMLSGIAGTAMVAALAPMASAAPASHPKYREGEIIVKFAPGKTGAQMASIASQASHGRASIAKTMASVGVRNVALARFGKGIPMEEMLAKFRATPGVVYAEPNFIASIPAAKGEAAQYGARSRSGHGTLDQKQMLNRLSGQAVNKDGATIQALNFPKEPLINSGWYWVEADAIWTDTVPNPMIAVLDTGVDYLHKDLSGRVVKGTDWINSDPDPKDDNGHGTHVAGAAAARTNNNIGISGVSNAMIYAVKVLGADGSGSYFEIAQGITQAANNAQVRVINMSLGGPDPTIFGGSDFNNTLYNAVALAVSKGKLILAAAGNQDTDDPHFPAFYADSFWNQFTGTGAVMAVAAGGNISYFDTCDDCWFIDYSCRAPYSNYGDWITIIAPGTDILSTTPAPPFRLNLEGVAGGYDYLSGTSMATPIAAGSAARAWASMGVTTTTAQQVKARLIATGYDDIAAGQGYFIDTDGDGSTDTECWDSAHPLGAVDVNVAAAMHRAQVVGSAVDANGSLPLLGGKAFAYQGAALKGTAGTIDNFDATFGTSGAFRIINVPWNATQYDIAIQKTGYTQGNQKFVKALVDAGSYFEVEQVGVPKFGAGRHHVVLDWDSVAFEFDSYGFTGPTIHCSVGYSGLCGAGSLSATPFMRWMADAGSFSGVGSSEVITMSKLYTAAVSGGPYSFFATDYSSFGPPAVAGEDFFLANPRARHWGPGAGGNVIKSTVRVEAGVTDVATYDCTSGVGGTGSNGCDTWYIGDLSNTGVFTPVNAMGVYGIDGDDPGGVFPFSRNSGSTRDGNRAGSELATRIPRKAQQ